MNGMAAVPVLGLLTQQHDGIIAYHPSRFDQLRRALINHHTAYYLSGHLCWPRRFTADQVSNSNSNIISISISIISISISISYIMSNSNSNSYIISISISYIISNSNSYIISIIISISYIMSNSNSNSYIMSNSNIISNSTILFLSSFNTACSTAPGGGIHHTQQSSGSHYNCTVQQVKRP
jgi:hypothetical protein